MSSNRCFFSSSNDALMILITFEIEKIFKYPLRGSTFCCGWGSLQLAALPGLELRGVCGREGGSGCMTYCTNKINVS